jgi:hypothetical protein
VLVAVIAGIRGSFQSLRRSGDDEQH